MEHSATFGRLFARLVALVVHEPDNIDEQKVVLRATLAVGRQGPVRLSVVDGGLAADGEPLASVLPGIGDLVECMRRAGVDELSFDAATPAAALLARARDLANGTVPGATTIEEAAPAAPAEPPSPAEAPCAEVESPPGDHPPAAHPPAEGPPPESPPVAASAPRAEVPGLVSDTSDALFYQFSTIGAVKDSPEALLEKLDGAQGLAETTRLIDDAVTLAETAAREGKPAAAADLMFGVVERERAASDPELKRAYTLALRRMSKPVMLRAVAPLLTADDARRLPVLAVMRRMEQEGAEAVVDQLTQAQTADDRRVLFEILRDLDAAVPALIHMLGDARWFVVRNAADLLGEMKAGTAERPLINVLNHSDERVRRAVTSALMQLGTESARQAVRAGMRDRSPQVRMQTAFAIAAHRDSQTATTLITAIDAETDSEVQHAMLLALGRVGTPEAVDRLIHAAEPGRGLFKKKSTALRVAAVQALAEVKTSAAQAALRALASDKDKEVRDTVARLQQRSRRR